MQPNVSRDPQLLYQTSRGGWVTIDDHLRRIYISGPANQSKSQNQVRIYTNSTEGKIDL
jgi:hypothetical protein